MTGPPEHYPGPPEHDRVPRKRWVPHICDVFLSQMGDPTTPPKRQTAELGARSDASAFGLAPPNFPPIRGRRTDTHPRPTPIRPSPSVSGLDFTNKDRIFTYGVISLFFFPPFVYGLPGQG
jgi:hypothetical protein